MSKKSSNSILIISGLVLVIGAIVGALFLFDRITQSKTEEIVMQEEVKERSADTIIIGLDPNYPPMEFLDEKAEMTGFDLDLIREAMPRLGKPYELQPIPWGEKDDYLNNGSIDLIWSGLNINDERKKIYEFSQAYIKDIQVFVVPFASDIESPEQLAQKRIAIEEGTFIRPVLEKMSRENPKGEFGDIVEYPSAAVAMTAILTGEVDAVVAGGLVTRYYASNSPEKFRILPEPVPHDTQGTGVAAKKGNTALIGQVNAALDAMRADGTFEKIEQKWFGK